MPNKSPLQLPSSHYILGKQILHTNAMVTIILNANKVRLRANRSLRAKRNIILWRAILFRNYHYYKVFFGRLVLKSSFET